MADFTIKRNDRLPKLRATLKQGTPPVAIDLTTADSVTARFKMVGGGGTTFNGACDIITPASGIVEYAWGATDTQTSGTYSGEFEIDWGGGLLETVPNDGYFTLTIVDDLG